MTGIEERECYACGMYGPNMILVATINDEEGLWACKNTEWCHARIVADRLFSDPKIVKVE